METIFLFAFSALREFDMDVALTVINLFVSLYKDGLEVDTFTLDFEMQ